jgi:acetyl-CoA acetyltransferase
VNNSVWIQGTALAGFPVSAHDSTVGLATSVALEAIRDATAQPDEVSAIYYSQTGSMLAGTRPASEIADQLGIRPRHLEAQLADGVTPISQIQAASRAIRTGEYETALVVYASRQKSSRTRLPSGPPAEGSPSRSIEISGGLPRPIGSAALVADFYLRQCGLPRDSLHSVAVSSRKWSARNPLAMYRDELTPEAIEESPFVATPLRRIDICPVTDGAGALILTAKRRRSAARLDGVATMHRHNSILHMSPFGRSCAAETAAEAASEAGYGWLEVDALQLYDAFSILPVVLLEDLGFCEAGKAPNFFASGLAAPGGSMPINTSGGSLAQFHPGSYGIFLVIEAVRQLTRTAPGLQIDARRILCQASGGGAFAGSQASLLISSDGGD